MNRLPITVDSKPVFFFPEDAQHMSQDQPNMLFLLSDQHRFDVLGYAGDDVVRTPTLDHLAETGVVFNNAYSPSPVCVPARHSIRTGQLPRTWDRYGFEAFEDHTYPTLPYQLGRYGYETLSAGEEHYTGWNQQQGWKRRFNHRRGAPSPPSAQGVADEGGEERGSLPPVSTGGERTHKFERAGIGDGEIQAWDRRVTGDIERAIADWFISPFEDRGARGRSPLLLKQSMGQPHPPFLTDRDKFEYYLNRVDPYFETPTSDHPHLTPGELVPGEDIQHRYLRRATAAYYGMVETIDELFGRTLDALKAAGEDLDEWVIVYTSDHGEALGQRGQWNKSRFYEETARVPLLIRYPERFEPGTVETNVTTCDIYATLCDLAGAPLPEDRDSRSLVPLLDGDRDGYYDRHGPYADEAISEGASNAAVREGVDQHRLMIKRGDLKYCYYDDAPEVLFDLDADPDEIENRAEDPAYEDAIETFRERRGELGYGPNADPEYVNAGY